MKPTFAAAVALKRAIQSLIGSAEGVVRIEAVLSESGPEVRVVVVKHRMKHFRLLLPTQRNGIPIVVQVSRD
jgi:hypothetical protein